MLLEHNIGTYNSIVSIFDSGIHDICYVQGTGTGKSFIFFELMENYFKDEDVLYVVPKHEVTYNIQSYPEFNAIKDRVHFQTYNYFNSDDALREVLKYNVIVVDEVHHIGSDVYGRFLRKLQKICIKKDKFFIGMTATPIRDMDHIDVRDYFTESVIGLTLLKAIEQGLTPPISYVLCQRELVNDAIKNKVGAVRKYKDADALLKEIISNNNFERWLVYFSNVHELLENKALIEYLFPDHPIYMIYSGSGVTTRDITTKRYVVMSVSMLLEGVHLKKANAILNMRNVQSLSLFEQIIGRVTAINSGVQPLFVDCTTTAQKLFKNLMCARERSVTDEEPSKPKKKSEPKPTPKKPIVEVSVINKQYIDLMKLLMLSKDEIVVYKDKTYNSIRSAAKALHLDYESLIRFKKYHKLTSSDAIKQYVDMAFEYKGNYYISMIPICNVNDIEHAMWLRYKRTHDTHEKDVAYNFIAYYNSFGFKFRGTHYSTLKECRMYYGISAAKFDECMTDAPDLTVQEALECCISGKKPLIKVYDSYFKSVREACDFYRVSYSAVRKQMLTRDMPAERAITDLCDLITITSITYRDKHYQCVKDILLEYDISEDTYFKYANTLPTLTVPQIIDLILLKEPPKRICVRGVYYSSLDDVEYHYNIPNGAIRKASVTKNMPLNNKFISDFVDKVDGVFYYGKYRFANFDSCCAAFGISVTRVMNYASRNNLTREEALAHFAKKG